MIAIKNSRELQAMREACVISARALKLAGEAVEPGVTTGEIDALVRRYIESQGAKPSFLGYGGFPGSACISVNEVVIHGIPGKRVIHAGDIVSVDVGAFFNGYHGDNAATFAAGDVSVQAQALMDGTPGRGPRLLPGMTLAIEPMINAGTHEVKILEDGWTTVTKDGKLAAHFEHTVAITPDGPVILTLP